ncbi:MAG: hypothetical protein GY861_04200, partial [bacterium]|nr:hypothetical protein [bacterium]
MEVEAPAHIFLTEDQYYAKDTISEKYTVLNRKTPRTKITEPVSTSTVAAAIVASAAKIFPKADKPFGSLPKDQWEPDEDTIKKLQKEASALLHQYGTADKRYIKKKKELEWTIKMENILQADRQTM